jgi:hypothetical protein
VISSAAISRYYFLPSRRSILTSTKWQLDFLLSQIRYNMSMVVVAKT